MPRAERHDPVVTSSATTPVRVVASIAEMQALARELQRRGKAVALVPTMGALHEGHLSLARRARAEGGALVVSIFVNPTQFGPSEDFARYPRNLERDLELVGPLAPEAVLAPSALDVYPPGFSSLVDPGEIGMAFEGASRPGHFRGVATVVLKLFNAVGPSVAYFGQKDFQQCVVIRRMVADLNLAVRVVVCPTVRDPDGLALSSRNRYLAADDRRAAPGLYRSLRLARETFQGGETRASALLDAMQSMLAGEPRLSVDYAAIVEPAGLKPVTEVETGHVALVAARVGGTRLIDNLIFSPRGATETELIDCAFASSPPSRRHPKLG
jgi:pantoate--beta-alanine ligase